MKYIFLTASVFFGITGISQAMDAFRTTPIEIMPVVFKLESVLISFQPFPGFVKIFLVSMCFFAMYLIWKHLRELGLRLVNYMPS